MEAQPENFRLLESDKLEVPDDTHSVKVPVRRSLLFLWHYTKPYLKDLVLAFAASIPLISIGWAIPWTLKQVTDLFTSKAALETILLWMLIALIVVSIKTLLEIFTTYVMTILHVKLSNDIRNDIYGYVHNNSLSFHMQNKSGELSSLVTNDSFAAAAGVLEGYSTLWQNPATVVCLIGVMVYFNPLLSLFAVISVPITGLLVTKAGKRAQHAERHFLERQGRILGWMVESLINVKQVKSFNLNEQQKKKFVSYGDELIQFRKKALMAKLIVSPITEVTSSLMLIFMGIVAYFQLAQGSATSGDIVACLTAAISLKKPVKMIATSYVTLQKSMAAIGRISWVTGQKLARNAELDFDETVQSIVFDLVDYSYDGRNKILKDVSFSIHKGDTVAIMGASGAGKTTLVDLLIGFFPCQKGQIKVNEIDLEQIRPESWRKQIGIVTQEPFLFDTTIEENIRMGYPDASQKRIKEVIQQTGCHEIIERLPEGLATKVGERGSLLSGGERKRIALARALVRPISVLILDEATGELDFNTEKEILETISQLSSDLIMIHVSHRKHILEYCDRALLIEQGRVMEPGIDACRERIEAAASASPGAGKRRAAGR